MVATLVTVAAWPQDEIRASPRSDQESAESGTDCWSRPNIRVPERWRRSGGRIEQLHPLCFGLP